MLNVKEVSRLRSACLGVCEEMLWQIQPGHVAEALRKRSVIENAALPYAYIAGHERGGIQQLKRRSP